MPFLSLLDDSEIGNVGRPIPQIGPLKISGTAEDVAWQPADPLPLTFIETNLWMCAWVCKSYSVSLANRMQIKELQQATVKQQTGVHDCEVSNHNTSSLHSQADASGGPTCHSESVIPIAQHQQGGYVVCHSNGPIAVQRGAPGS
ncbi:hypothetical protein EYF80_010617 [Liparis tanakae]|uniref:Uncharacterized protein n=1 Tax=Liparis tanakae TaxID=230148 RepID=A0A4Z2IMB5_9TELE|nr:hypothetical protein EYF80_010617 [Liparis tanakae]